MAICCLRALAFVLFCGRKQLKTNLIVALVAHGEALIGFKGGFMRQAMLRVRDLIDPRGRNHFSRLVNCLVGI